MQTVDGCFRKFMYLVRPGKVMRSYFYFCTVEKVCMYVCIHVERDRTIWGEETEKKNQYLLVCLYVAKYIHIRTYEIHTMYVCTYVPYFHLFVVR